MTDYPGLGGLDDAFGEIFSECRGRGMPLPYLVALVGINGSSTVYRMTAGKDHDGLDAEALVSHEVGGGFAIPIDCHDCGRQRECGSCDDGSRSHLYDTLKEDAARSSASVRAKSVVPSTWTSLDLRARGSTASCLPHTLGNSSSWDGGPSTSLSTSGSLSPSSSRWAASTSNVISFSSAQSSTARRTIVRPAVSLPHDLAEKT